MFTDEELLTLAQIIRSIPITGTLESLPPQLGKLMSILDKIESEMERRAKKAED